jgi:hypothetical protein
MRITRGLLATFLAMAAISFIVIVFPRGSYPNTWGKSGQDYCGVFFASAASLAAPDMTFGNFTITEAKVIDASWNLVLGRGLQGLLLLISCRVCRGALQWITESTPVSFELFETLAFDPFSWAGTITLFKGYLRMVGWRARSTLLFFLFSALFIIALPTMNDLQTGYIQTSKAYAQAPNGTLLTLDDPALNVQCDPHPPHLCVVSDMAIVCVPQNGYQWGFSSIWVSIVLCLLTIWAFGMYGVWVDTTRRSVLHANGRQLGKWRAIADLGCAIRHELGSDLNNLSDPELKEKLGSAKRIGYSTQHERSGEIDHVVLSSEVSGVTSLLMKDNEA